jgi:hypothetical protein
MPYQTWIIDAARATGYPVVEVAGWQTRGSSSFDPRGVVCHHTAGAATGDMPSLNLIVNGRSDLPGPLSQFGLGRSGTIYVVAAGRANHAGAGGWKGLVGNSSVFGIEAEHTGARGVPWPTAQLDAYERLIAQLCKRGGFDPSMVCAHREWAPSRKIDPTGIDMNEMREAVAAVLWMEANMTTFKDVPENYWAHDDIEWCAANGIARGYSGDRVGQFGPNDFVTRAQMAAFLRRAVRLVSPEQAK